MEFVNIFINIIYIIDIATNFNSVMAVYLYVLHIDTVITDSLEIYFPYTFT